MVFSVITILLEYLKLFFKLIKKNKKNFYGDILMLQDMPGFLMLNLVRKIGKEFTLKLIIETGF